MKHISSIFVIGLMLVLTGCSDFLDVNTDPNNPSPDQISAELVLPSAQMQIAGSLGGVYSIVGGLWSQHYAQSNASSQFRNEERYALTKSSGIYQTAWVDLYSDGLIDLKIVKDKAAEEEEWNSYLQATCLMAYTYQILADFYGQIPFTEALQGKDIPEPRFDAGQDVYDGLITLIDEALAKDLTASTTRAFPSDFVFGTLGKDAQIASWVQFANTLKLKIYMRQTFARSSVASAGVSGLLASDNFLTNGAMINVFSDVPDNSNPFFESTARDLNTDGNLRMSQTLFSWLDTNTDTRLDVHFRPGSGGHAALAQGDFNSAVAGTVPSIANPNPSAPFFFFSADEVEFMLAEANLRYGSGTAAQTHYENGVLAAFSRLGLNGSSLLSGVYAYPAGGSFDDKLEAIMTQKWASNVERGYESFFDHNRTGLPDIYTYSVSGATSGAFPKRLIFPDRTTRINSNAPADVAITVPVWWAQ